MDINADPDAVGFQSYKASGMLKDTGTIEGGDGLWYLPNTSATNETGFTALPAGYRFYLVGNYNAMGTKGFFWSSSEYDSTNAWYRNCITIVHM